jgi:hypothetical protein
VYAQHVFPQHVAGLGRGGHLQMVLAQLRLLPKAAARHHLPLGYEGGVTQHAEQQAARVGVYAVRAVRRVLEAGDFTRPLLNST